MRKSIFLELIFMLTVAGLAVVAYDTIFSDPRASARTSDIPHWQYIHVDTVDPENSEWDQNTAISRMTVVSDSLFLSTANETSGGEIWRTKNGVSWEQVSTNGFGTNTNDTILVGDTFRGYLYAGTLNPTSGGEIWRCEICDGSDWEQVVSGGLGDINNSMVERIVLYSDTLYATTNNSVTGVEIWSSSTGTAGSWQQCNIDGFGDDKNTELFAVTTFAGYLYVATSQWGSYGTGAQTGIEVWRTTDCNSWTQVNSDGFGTINNVGAWLESFGNALYLLAQNPFDGTEVWRCSDCDGSDWERVVTGGFGDANNTSGAMMLEYDNDFYLATYNEVTGTEIWRTSDGLSWGQANEDSFISPGNIDVWSGIVFKNHLFFGTVNETTGGQVRRLMVNPASLTLPGEGKVEVNVISIGGPMDLTGCTGEFGLDSPRKEPIYSDYLYSYNPPLFVSGYFQRGTNLVFYLLPDKNCPWQVDGPHLSTNPDRAFITQPESNTWILSWEDWTDEDFNDLHIEVTFSNSDTSSEQGFSDEFNDGLDPRWFWIDPNNDSTYSVTDRQGFLRISAPSGNDLFPDSNYDAPRLIQPISGDFALETLVEFNPTQHYQGAGIVIWQDRDNFLRLEHSYYYGSGRAIRFSKEENGVFSGVSMPPSGITTTASQVELRLTREITRFVASWRTPGNVWQDVGSTDINFSASILAGLDLIAEWGVPQTSADFDFFHVSRAPTYYVTGRVTDVDNIPISDVTVSAGAASSATTDASGYYTIAGLITGTYAIMPTKSGWTFSPASRTVSVPPDATGQDFTGTWRGGGEVDAELQLHAAKALPPNSPIRPSVTVIHTDPCYAEYTLKMQLWQGFTLVDELPPVQLVFDKPGSELRSLDFGWKTSGTYVIWAELWLGGDRIAIETSRVTVGLDYVELEEAVNTFTEGAFSELREAQYHAVYAAAQATSQTESAAVGLVLNDLIEFLLAEMPGVGNVAEGFIKAQVEVFFNRGGELDDMVRLMTFEEKVEYWLAYLDAQSFDARRTNIYTAKERLLDFAVDQSLVWDPDWGQTLFRKRIALQGISEYEPLGFRVSVKSPYVEPASLRDMRDQFRWLEGWMYGLHLATQVLAWVFIGLLVVLFLVAIPGVAAAAPAAEVIAAAIAAKWTLFTGLTTGLGKVFSWGKLLSAAVLLSSLALCISGVAEHVALVVQEAHQDGIDFVWSCLTSQSQAPALPTNSSDTESILTAEVEASSEGYSIKVLGEDPSTWLDTQLFQGDGTLLELRHHSLRGSQTRIDESWDLPNGQYWLVTSMHGPEVKAQKVVFTVSEPSLALDLALSDEHVALGDTVTATISLTNLDPVTDTDDLVISLISLDGLLATAWWDSLPPETTAHYMYTFTIQSEGGHVLRASVADSHGDSMTQVDRAYSVGDVAAVAINKAPGGTCLPRQTITWTMSAINAGTQPTSTVVTLSTYAHTPELRMVYSSTYALDLAPGGSTTFSMPVMEDVRPGMYEWILELDDRFYDMGSYLVQAEGALFAVAKADPRYVSPAEAVTITIQVEDEAYTAVEASVSLTILTPAGDSIDLAPEQLELGWYRSTFSPPITGTYEVSCQAGKSGYASAAASTSFAAGAPSLLIVNTDGHPVVGQQTAVTMTVQNENQLPVADATVIVSTTNGLMIGLSDDNGVARLSIHHDSTAPNPVTVERTGYASTSLSLHPEKPEYRVFLPFVLRQN